MTHREQWKYILGGLFFVIGIGIITTVIFVIGVNKGFAEPKFQVAVLYKDVAGLSTGAPVRLSGVNVGLVRSIEFLPQPIEDRELKVVLDIFMKYRKQVEKAVIIAIRTEGVLGEKLIEITTNSRRVSIDLSRPIIGEEPLDVYDMAQTLEDTSHSFQQTGESIQEMMKDLQYISRKMKRLMDRVEQRVIDGNLFKVF